MRGEDGMVEKELLGVMKENLDKDATRGKKDVDCCCPSFIFLF